MRLFQALSAIGLLFTAGLASAQQPESVSELIASQGLAAAQEQLAALPDPGPDDLFALGGVRFLRGIEKTLQLRWQHNMVLKGVDMPVLRLPVPPNPSAKPFEPQLITGLFSRLLEDMKSSRAALAAIPPDAAIATRIDLASLWFDVNMNGKRDAGEDVIDLGARTLMSRAAIGTTAVADDLTVQFDTADRYWLMAYTDLLSGISEIVLAYDPTKAITQVLESDTAMKDFLGDTPPANAMDMQFGGWVDQFAMAYGALNSPPDAGHTRAAHAYLLRMIKENKSFWQVVATETDNTDEWIPNRDQTAALGYELPANAGKAWQAVLQDAEDILNGKLLISYWRISPAGGVNVKKLFMDPPVVDIVTWVQGAGLLPYLERGPTATPDSLNGFARIMSGDTALFAILFN